MKNILGNLLLVLALATFAGCHKPPATAEPNAADKPILAMIRTQTDAFNHRDVDAMMATFDPASAVYANSKAVSDQMFKIYDLHQTIEAMKVESIDGDTARVRVRQLTEKISGPAFRNNRIEAIHTVKKIDGQWKLSTSEVISTDFLDK